LLRSTYSSKKRLLNKIPASILATIPAETRTIPRFQLQSPLPFTVTKPVTRQEMSIAVEYRDVNLVFGKGSQREQLRLFDPCPLIADDPSHRPDIPWTRPENTLPGKFFPRKSLKQLQLATQNSALRGNYRNVTLPLLGFIEISRLFCFETDSAKQTLIRNWGRRFDLAHFSR